MLYSSIMEWYEILGVGKDASRNEIKNAFWKKGEKFDILDPDLANNKDLQELNDAYDLGMEKANYRNQLEQSDPFDLKDKLFDLQITPVDNESDDLCKIWNGINLDSMVDEAEQKFHENKPEKKNLKLFNYLAGTITAGVALAIGLNMNAQRSQSNLTKAIVSEEFSQDKIFNNLNVALSNEFSKDELDELVKEYNVVPVNGKISNSYKIRSRRMGKDLVYYSDELSNASLSSDLIQKLRIVYDVDQQMDKALNQLADENGITIDEMNKRYFVMPFVESVDGNLQGDFSITDMTTTQRTSSTFDVVAHDYPSIKSSLVEYLTPKLRTQILRERLLKVSSKAFAEEYKGGNHFVQISFSNLDDHGKRSNLMISFRSESDRLKDVCYRYAEFTNKPTEEQYMRFEQGLREQLKKEYSK